MSARRADRARGGPAGASRAALTSGAAPLLADFELFEELGHGATSIVYRARRRGSKGDVALKVVRPPKAQNAPQSDDEARRFIGEARTAARLSHPNLIAPLDVRSLPDGRVALVMPLVRGPTLRQLLRESGQLAVAQVERIVRDIASALSHAHARGVVHLDVKPENIFLETRSGRALLADFGIARSLGGEDSGSDAAGTPTYMAPEQIDGAQVSGATDLYGLGLVTWEMLSGERPWIGEELHAILQRQKSDPLPPLGALRPDVPERLHFLVTRLTEKSPGDRWSDAESFLREWESAEPREGWRRWRLTQETRAREWNESRERLMSDVSAYADRLGHLAAQTDVPTLERLEPVRGAAVQPKRRRVAAGAAVTALAFVVAASVLALRARSSAAPTGTAATRDRDSRGIEVPSLASPVTARRDSTTRLDSAPSTSARARADSPLRSAARADSAHGDAHLAQTPRAASADSSVDAPPTDSPATATLDHPVGTRGLSTPASSSVPPLSLDVSPPIAAGGRQSCALAEVGGVVCWGAGDDGALGDGRTSSHAVAMPVAEARSFSQVSSGFAHSCAITDEGEAFCWGANDHGQVGDRSVISRSAPTRVETDVRYRLVRAGGAHSCAITTGWQVTCWGSNSNGQVGAPLTGTIVLPVLVPGISGRVVALSTGRQHTCAVTEDGAAWCWGYNAQGQLGDGSTTDRRIPVRVGAPTRFSSIAAGGAHTCGVGSDGSVWCWGANESGQLGAGTSSAESWRVPTKLESADAFAEITAGAAHSCARTRAGVVFCWGLNAYGQLGDGTTSDRDRPTALATSLRFTAVQASAAHSCAVATSGERFCWGYNVDGQLGDGTRENRARPVRVRQVTY